MVLFCCCWWWWWSCCPLRSFFDHLTETHKCCFLLWGRLHFLLLPYCSAAMSRILQTCIGVGRSAWSQSWQVATRIGGWNDQIFCKNMSERETRSETCGCWARWETTGVPNARAIYKIKLQSQWLTMIHNQMQNYTVFCVLRHYEGVLSRLPQHAVNVERRRSEAIFVPVSAFIKTQPGGENNGGITDGTAANRVEDEPRKRSRLTPWVLKTEHCVGRDVTHPGRASPNVPNWQRCVSDGHQRSSLVKEKHAVLLLKNLQTWPRSLRYNRDHIHVCLWFCIV